MKTIAKTVLTLGLLALSPQALAVDSLAKANELYEAGDCKQALTYFASAQEQAARDESALMQILFRKSYCQLNMGQNTEAESGFASYLKKDPDNDEARLRLAVAEFNLAKYQEARTQTAKVKSADFKAEAALYSARAAIELNEPQAALHDISAVRDGGGEWKPALLYWKAVALYKSNDSQEALRTFNAAIAQAPADSWVKTDGRDWTERIKSENKMIRGYVTLGYLSDSNISESATANLTGGGPGGGGQGGGPGGQGGPGGGPGGQGGPGGGPGQGGAPLPSANSNSISDSGSYVNLGLTLNPYTRATRNVTSSLTYSTPNYSDKNKSYDYEVAGIDVSANFQGPGNDWFGLKVQYLETFYNHVSNQNYLIVDPYYGWAVNSDWYVRFELTDNMYRKTASTYTLAPAVTATYSLSDSLSLKVGGSSTSGKGQTAVFDNAATPPTILSGSMYSNYTTVGAFIGFWSSWKWGIEASGQVGYYQTSYPKEDVKQPPGQGDPGNRNDKLTSYGVELMYPIIKNFWSVDLSATISKNDSTGLQGIPNNGTITTYSYNRTYVLATTTLSF